MCDPSKINHLWRLPPAEQASKSEHKIVAYSSSCDCICREKDRVEAIRRVRRAEQKHFKAHRIADFQSTLQFDIGLTRLPHLGLCNCSTTFSRLLRHHQPLCLRLLSLQSLKQLLPTAQFALDMTIPTDTGQVLKEVRHLLLPPNLCSFSMRRDISLPWSLC